MAERLARAGMQIVSGGAIGIDIAAHKGAMAAGAPTFAVMACGLDRPYPERHHDVFMRMCDEGGGLLSAYPPGTPPLRRNFLERNGVLASLADWIVVVSADQRSGALSTAGHAQRLSRPLAVVPGTPGCDQLIAAGAEIVESEDDLLDLLEGRRTGARVSLPEPGTVEAAILAKLDVRTPRTADGLADGDRFPYKMVLSTLANLELLGLATMNVERRYLRSALAERLLGR
jgi:DNA processing protein